MTKEETDLIGEAIDFYNLNHFKGGKTKKQLVKLKKQIKALTISVVVKSLPEWRIYQKAQELDEKEFEQWMYDNQ
tara:strand:- start:1112 stop:1336 length:225 start_codon:yes stop_codon:yes gene_type:complete